MIFKKLAILLIITSCAHRYQDELTPPTPKTKTKTVNIKSVKECRRQINYFKLLSKLTKTKTPFKVFNKLSTQELCQENLGKTQKLLAKHNEKIGILYHPSNDPQKDKAILDGLIVATKTHKGLSKKDFYVKKIKKSKNEVNKALSHLVLKKKVGLIVTWGDDKFTQHIQKWEKGLKLPTIYIHKNIKNSTQSFKVYPNKANYAFEMIKELRQRNIKRIAILTPEHYRQARFLTDIKKVFKAAGIQIVFDQTYTSTNYDSMNMACRKIFVIDRFSRAAEYNAIYQSEKRKAAAQGFKLNPKLVFLPAQVNFDAIFIPDNFKIVNHFVKLFEYYKVRKIPLFGTHEWRSPELTEAKQDFLNGSFFVDFIGDKKHYKRFNHQDRMSLDFDYKLMGYYSGLLGQKAVRSSQKNRKKVVNKLKNLKLTPQEKAFRQNQFNWPSYSFEIQQNKILPNQ